MISVIKKIVPAPIKSFIKKLLGKESVKNSDIIPVIRKVLRSDVVTVLDVGCGQLWEGNSKEEDILFSLFDSPKYKVTGIDVFEDCIKWRKEHGPKGRYITMDARNLSRINEKFDVIIAHHVLEHFPKEESEKLLSLLESMATKQVIIGTPVGFTNTEYAVELHGNEAERHLCGWLPSEFRDRGYNVTVLRQALLASKIV